MVTSAMKRFFREMMQFEDKIEGSKMWTLKDRKKVGMKCDA